MVALAPCGGDAAVALRRTAPEPAAGVAEQGKTPMLARIHIPEQSDGQKMRLLIKACRISI
jgi:hypothetical protein